MKKYDALFLTVAVLIPFSSGLSIGDVQETSGKIVLSQNETGQYIGPWKNMENNVDGFILYQNSSESFNTSVYIELSDTKNGDNVKRLKLEKGKNTFQTDKRNFYRAIVEGKGYSENRIETFEDKSDTNIMIVIYAVTLGIMILLYSYGRMKKVKEKARKIT